MDTPQRQIPDNAQVDNIPPPEPVTLAQAFWYWLKLGFISFGGPAGQIAIIALPRRHHSGNFGVRLSRIVLPADDMSKFQWPRNAGSRIKTIMRNIPPAN